MQMDVAIAPEAPMLVQRAAPSASRVGQRALDLAIAYRFSCCSAPYWR